MILRIIVLVACATSTSLAQTKLAEAKLPSVNAPGFYHIPLSADLTSFAAEGFGNIRIKDGENREVPYLLRQEQPVFTSTSFKEYAMEKKIVPGCCTEITLPNPTRRPIDNISFRIVNADATKQAKLIGSTDRTVWFVLKEQFYLGKIDNESSTSALRLIEFPRNDYSFIKLIINDSISEPLNVESAGYYENFSSDGDYVVVEDSISFADTGGKQTRMVVHFDTSHFVDKLKFDITSPQLYHRRATLYVEESRIRNKKEELFERYVTSFELTSFHADVVNFPSTKANKLIVYIDNGDSPQFTFASVTAYQLKRYLIAWLEPGKEYAIVAHPDDMAVPQYDLGYFADSIPAQPTVLLPDNMVRFEQKRAESFTVFSDRNIIWGSIVGVALLLAYMSVKMIRKTGPADRAD